jgi:hypothetical protein
MNRKVGDTVRIQTQEWIDAQEDKGGYIANGEDVARFITDMFKYAGRIAKIRSIKSFRYKLNIDNEWFSWEDWMFDPSYDPDAPLSAEDAIRAMLDGETFYDEDGWEYFWDKENRDLCRKIDGKTTAFCVPNLHRRPAKRKRPMTIQEIAAWVTSEDSLGWMVKYIDCWCFPRSMRYLDRLCEYQRARLLPDLSGIDKSTIQGFEVEDERL